MVQQQTTMKIGRAVLNDLKEISALAHRSPQKQVEHWVAEAKRQAGIKERRKVIRAVEASEALEGYPPLADADPEAHVRRERFILGEITIQEYIDELVQLANG